jgi:membrane associated rhomboid family serine protease
MNRYQMQNLGIPLTPTVKKLIIANVVIWFIGVLIIQRFFLSEPYLFNWFGLIPERIINDFWVWQPFTYMFLHSNSILHVLFNMLILWWVGADLEPRWGPRFFLTYYFVCGVGAGFFYLLGVILYSLFGGHSSVMGVPVIGASGAVFGLMLAFGMLFGERIVYFMMIFPMKAKYFVALLGGIELVTLLNSGQENNVANLAHLGGLAAGYLFLKFRGRFSGFKGGGRPQKKGGPQLRLVVDNDRGAKQDGVSGGPPRYWN